MCLRSRPTSGSAMGTRPARCSRAGFPSGEVLVSPRERRPVEASSGRELPLLLGRKALPRPCSVCLGILDADMDDGVTVAAVHRRPGSGGSPPRRPGTYSHHCGSRRDRSARPCAKDERARHEQLGSASGYALGSTGRSAWVTYPVAARSSGTRPPSPEPRRSRMDRPSRDVPGAPRDRTPPSPSRSFRRAPTASPHEDPLESSA